MKAEGCFTQWASSAPFSAHEIALYGCRCPIIDTYKCCRCKERLPRAAFGGITKRQDYCKTCRREIDREYASTHRAERNAQNRACAARRYETNRTNLAAYLLSHPCVDCGEDDIIVLEFDHRDPALKRSAIAHILGSWTWATIMKEIAKCDVRCANCHRRRTARQLGWFKGVMPNDTDEGLD